jgi:hypothetical protein
MSANKSADNSKKREARSAAGCEATAAEKLYRGCGQRHTGE